jgi:hypothetical protein
MPLLREVLSDPKAFDINLALFADRQSLRLESDCLLLDPDDVDDVDDVPDEARAAGYDYILSLNDVDSIIDNLLAQTRDPSDDLRLEALRFYLARDAFIVVQP